MNQKRVFTKTPSSQFYLIGTFSGPNFFSLTLLIIFLLVCEYIWLRWMAKIKLGKLFYEVSSLNLSFSFSIIFAFKSFCLLFCLLEYILICLPRLGLGFCMLKMHVRLLELLFWSFALFFVFLGFWGKDLHT